MINQKYLAELIDKLAREGKHSGLFVRDMIRSDMPGVDSPEHLKESSEFYFDPSRALLLIRLVVIEEIAKRDQRAAERAIAEVIDDQGMRGVLLGHILTREAALRMMGLKDSSESGSMQHEIDKAAQNSGC